MYAATIPTQQSIWIAPTQPQYNIQQLNLLPLKSNENRSLALIGLGIAQLIISSLFFCWSVGSRYVLVIENFTTVFCCVYHLILSVLAIVGGRNIIVNRCFVSIGMGLAIFGAAVVSIATIALDVWSWHPYLPLCISVAIQAILDVAISILGCSKLCQCCGAHSVIVPTELTAQPQYITQPLNSNPPYSFHPAYNPAVQNGHNYESNAP